MVIIIMYCILRTCIKSLSPRCWTRFVALIASCPHTYPIKSPQTSPFLFLLCRCPAHSSPISLHRRSTPACCPKGQWVSCNCSPSPLRVLRLVKTSSAYLGMSRLGRKLFTTYVSLAIPPNPAPRRSHDVEFVYEE